MKKLIYSIQAEYLKLKGTGVLWISIGGSFLLPVIFTLRILYTGKHINTYPTERNGWEIIYMQMMRIFTAFLLPMGAILICTLITQIEYRNNNWKQVHTSPQSYSRIFGAKFILLIGLTLGVYILSNMAMLLPGAVPCLVFTGKLPFQPIPIGTMLNQTAKSFLVCLPVISIQYLVGLRFKNFLISLGGGLGMMMLTLMIMRVPYGYYSPYTLPFLYFDKRLIPEGFPVYIWATVYTLVFIILSYVLYISKKIKG